MPKLHCGECCDPARARSPCSGGRTGHAIGAVFLQYDATMIALLAALVAALLAILLNL